LDRYRIVGALPQPGISNTFGINYIDSMKSMRVLISFSFISMISLLRKEMISRLIGSFFLLTSIANAQSVNGNIEGRILDNTGQPIPGANVVVSGPNLIGTRGAATNDDGFFRILALPSGAFSVKISHISYQEQTISGITVPLGATTKLPDIHLQLQIMEASEVVVWAGYQVTDPTSTSMGENLTPTQLEGLPLDRSYQAIAKLLPQANESYYGDGVSIMGATGSENKYFINGIDVTDPFRGSSSTSLPYNFVREIQVRTGGYEAEYRGSLGVLLRWIPMPVEMTSTVSYMVSSPIISPANPALQGLPCPKNTANMM
jgi:Carboxypeptidase regulatory-like domain